MSFRTVIASEAKQSHHIVRSLPCSGFFFKLVLCFTIVLLPQISFAVNISPGDSSKNKYDINDPRNPQCPCHKYQKQADDEFKQFQKKENKDEGNVISNN